MEPYKELTDWDAVCDPEYDCYCWTCSFAENCRDNYQLRTTLNHIERGEFDENN